jgi:threonine synthase
VLGSAADIDRIIRSAAVSSSGWRRASMARACSRSSAASIAGLLKCASDDKARYAEIPERSRIVCTVTGHGLKDPEVMADCVTKMAAVAPNEQEVLRAIGF